MPEKAKLTYEEAIERLQDIVAALESGALPLDKVSENIKEAQQLLEQCRATLSNVETEVNELLNHGKE